MNYIELTAEKWRKQAVGTMTPLEVGLQETLDLMRVNMLALEMLAKELRRG